MKASTAPASERGVMSISLALTFPLVMIMILLVVQGALLWYDREVALSAARTGSDAARGYQPDAGAGALAANRLLTQLGTKPADRKVLVPTVMPGSTTITVTVKVRVPALLPGMNIWVTQTVVAPIERFVPEGA